MKKALVVDDHPLVCRGLKDLLQALFPSLEVKTSAGGDGVLQEVCGTPWAFVVLDISLPGQDGLSILMQTKACRPELPIIAFSAHSVKQYSRRALRAGAIAYFSKESSPRELIEMVRQILDGSKIRRPLAKQPAFSTRERQVLALLRKGMRRKEISQQLRISVKTVSTFQANLVEKLDLRNTAELVRYAFEEGLAED